MDNYQIKIKEFTLTLQKALNGATISMQRINYPQILHFSLNGNGKIFILREGKWAHLDVTVIEKLRRYHYQIGEEGAEDLFISIQLYPISGKELKLNLFERKMLESLFHSISMDAIIDWIPPGKYHVSNEYLILDGTNTGFKIPTSKSESIKWSPRKFREQLGLVPKTDDKAIIVLSKDHDGDCEKMTYDEFENLFGQNSVNDIVNTIVDNISDYITSDVHQWKVVLDRIYESDDKSILIALNFELVSDKYNDYTKEPITATFVRDDLFAILSGHLEDNVGYKQNNIFYFVGVYYMDMEAGEDDPVLCAEPYNFKYYR